MIRALNKIIIELNKEIVKFEDYYSNDCREQDLISVALKLYIYAVDNCYFSLTEGDKNLLRENLDEFNECIAEEIMMWIDETEIEEDEVCTVLEIFTKLYKNNNELLSLLLEIDSRLENPNFLINRYSLC